MQNFQTSNGWSVRFKRELVFWSITAATPLLQLVSRFSNILQPIMLKASIASLVLMVLGFAYLCKNLTVKDEPPASGRESYIIRAVLALVLALTIANVYFLLGGHATHATPLR